MEEIKVLSEFTKTAKESMPCEACRWLKTAMNPSFMKQLTPKEVLLVQKAAQKNFMIIKGMRYVTQEIEFRGKVWTSNFMPKIHDLCIKYGVYERTNHSNHINN